MFMMFNLVIGTIRQLFTVPNDDLINKI